MDIDRIQEIINSSSLINVHYGDIPVFIQQVDNATQTATVFFLNDLTYKQIVDIKKLTEVKEPIPYIMGGVTMNKQRAQEISQSPDMKHVMYNGEQVYIQHVDEQNNTARIFPINDPDNEFEVALDNLKETDH